MAHVRRRNAAVGAVPPLVVASVALVVGRPLLATVSVVLSAAMLGAALLGLPVHRWVTAAAEAVASAVVALISILVGLGLTIGWAAAAVSGRDALRGGRKRRRTPAWTASPSQSSVPGIDVRQFRLERPARSSRPSRHPALRATWSGLTRALGLLLVVLVVDLSVGWAWNRLQAPTEQVAEVAINFTGTPPTGVDPLADTPAMAGAPWSRELFEETNAARAVYWPFTELRFTDFSGEFVNVSSWRRRTYVAPDLADGAAPVIWMFGGSTTWGIGQRDLHTIASEIGRLSEAAGSPAVVVNYGQRTWTHFQEMLLFEQELARLPAPDMVVFYDGINDINSYDPDYAGVPNHVFSPVFDQLMTSGRAVAPEQSLLDATTDAYLRSSALARAVGALRGGDDTETNDRIATTTDPGAENAALDFRTAARSVMDVYARGRTLSGALAEQHGVEPFYFWQPTDYGGAMNLFTQRELDEPTIDLTDALDDHRDVYIDGNHTNEAGARIIAERIWDSLQPSAERWHSDHVRTPSDAPSNIPQATTTTAAIPSGDARPDPAGDADALERLAATRRRLDAIGTDLCRLETFMQTVDFQGYDTPQRARWMVDLIASYFGKLAAAAPPDQAEEAATLRAAADELIRLAEREERPTAWDYIADGPVQAPATTAAFAAITARSPQECPS